jgi:aminomethyltransferase
MKKRVVFKITDKSAPSRLPKPIWAGGVKVGEAASSTQSPSLGIGIGMDYVPPEFGKANARVGIEIRGKRFLAVIVTKPIYGEPAAIDSTKRAEKLFLFCAFCAFLWSTVL